MRSIFKEGLEAALRADPEVLEKCKPKTGAGLFVRGLVLEAGKGKTTSIRALLSLIDREPDKAEEGEEFVDETRWDWNADGVWQTFPEAETEEGGGEEDGWAERELRRRLTRLLAGDEADRARAAVIIERMRTDNFEHPGGGPAAPPP